MDISTEEAARRLRVTRQRVLVMLREGQLTGRRVGRTWAVDEASVAARLAFSISAGPPWRPTTAVRIVNALTDQLSLAPRESTLVHRLEPQDLATKIGQLVTVRRYTTRWMDEVPDHLELTGESAVNLISHEPWQKLHSGFHAVHGYARNATNLQFLERAARLVADPEGIVFVYSFKGSLFPWPQTPAALIAADCLRSTSTRVRSAGMTALAEMRTRWLHSIG